MKKYLLIKIKFSEDIFMCAFSVLPDGDSHYGTEQDKYHTQQD